MQHAVSLVLALIAVIIVVLGAAWQKRSKQPPLIGSECASRGPAYYDACCEMKLAERKADRSCDALRSQPKSRGE